MQNILPVHVIEHFLQTDNKDETVRRISISLPNSPFCSRKYCWS